MTDHDDHLADRIRTSGSDSRIAPPDPARVIAAGRRRRRKDRLLASGAAVVVALGVVLPLRALSPFGDGSFDRGSAVSTGPETLPDEVGIDCDGDRVALSASSIQPQSDGVHMRVEYGGGTQAVVLWDTNDKPPSEYSGFELDPDEALVLQVFPLPPGSYLVGCIRTAADSDSVVLDSATAVALDIVDVRGLWTSQDLDCDRVDLDRFVPIGERFDEELLRAAIPGILLSDSVRPLGYPNGVTAMTWGVVRDGTLIAKLDIMDMTAWERGWVVEAGSACQGSGVGGAQGESALTRREVLTLAPIDVEEAVDAGWPATVEEIERRVIAWYQEHQVGQTSPADLMRAVSLLRRTFHTKENGPAETMYVTEMTMRLEAVCRSLPASQFRDEFCSATSLPDLNEQAVPWLDPPSA